MTKTPRALTRTIANFCRNIEPDRQPVSIPVVPHYRAKLCDCFANTEHKIQVAGGSKQYGWIIWEWAGVLIEAEFHSVWVSPEGNLVDVTPHVNGATRIVFLPDSKRVWDRKTVPNVIQPLRADPLIRELLEVVRGINRLREEYTTDDGAALVPARMYKPLETRRRQICSRIESKLAPQSAAA